MLLCIPSEEEHMNWLEFKSENEIFVGRKEEKECVVKEGLFSNSLVEMEELKVWVAMA